MSEGFLHFQGHRTWYRISGDLHSGKVPLLLLHGGPGMGGAAFEPLEALAHSRAVIRYDQLGCGRSDRPGDPSLWQIPTFTRELDAIRSELGLERVHLLGWSWGGMLALEYLLGQPKGIVSLTLASSLCSTAFWAEETRRLRMELPEPVQATMRRFEESFQPTAKRRQRDRPGPSAESLRRQARLMAIGTRLMSGAGAQRLAAWASRLPFLRAAAYQVASIAFLHQHVCRLPQPPDALFQSLAGFNPELYEVMWGPSEFFPTGSLADWNVEERLGEIDLPTLITSGRFDEATPAQMEQLRDGIPGSRWVCFEQSAHCAHIEEPERYLAVLEGFLDASEGAPVELAPGDDLGLRPAQQRSSG
ncbi:MAG: alpha/beta fold hydrolase [bacterium]|nr:alpha/beta fold hydrolase [bacterium]